MKDEDFISANEILRMKKSIEAKELDRMKQAVEDTAVALLCKGVTWDDVLKTLYPIEINPDQVKKIEKRVRIEKLKKIENHSK